MKLNCWEAKKCGRQPGGEKNSDLGICPAAITFDAHGINDGTNGGRACWAIEDTMCSEKYHITFSQKSGTCLNCDFYIAVRNEERCNFKNSKEILSKLH